MGYFSQPPGIKSYARTRWITTQYLGNGRCFHIYLCWGGGGNQIPPNTHTHTLRTHHHFRQTAPPLWQQNVPQLPLRPHPHLTKPMMIPMTIFYSWQVATAPWTRNPESQTPHRIQLTIRHCHRHSLGQRVATVRVWVLVLVLVQVLVRPSVWHPFHSSDRYHVSSCKVFSCNQAFEQRGDQRDCASRGGPADGGT